MDETLWRAANLPPEELLEDGHAGDMLAARGSRETLYATLRRNRKRSVGCFVNDPVRCLDFPHFLKEGLVDDALKAVAATG